MTKLPLRQRAVLILKKRGCPFLGKCGSSRWEGEREKCGSGGLSESDRVQNNFL